MQLLKNILAILAIVLILVNCGKEDPVLVVEPEIEEPTPENKVNFPPDKGFEQLADYNLFVGDLVDLTPNTDEGVIPYDLNTALFSDYAFKKRFIYVPEGSVIPFDTTGVLDLPIGSILIKHFYFLNPDGSEKYIETRLFLHKKDGWQAENYEWNAEKTAAKRTVVGGTRNLTVDVNGTTQTFNYLIPNQNQCKNCHGNSGSISPIGPVVANLNKEYTYLDGTFNQLDKWKMEGILENVVGVHPKFPKIGDTEVDINTRARAYLDVNCASCHSRTGSAANSGLYLEYTNRDSLSLGYFKTPVAAGDGSGGLSYAIVPGQADRSILLYRMTSSVIDERMPEIGRELAHEEGIELIKDWINSME